jgi:hypothetical protein
MNTRALDHRDLIFKSLYLEEQGSHAAHLGLLLDEDLEVLVDDGHPTSRIPVPDPIAPMKSAKTERAPKCTNHQKPQQLEYIC